MADGLGGSMKQIRGDSSGAGTTGCRCGWTLRKSLQDGVGIWREGAVPPGFSAEQLSGWWSHFLSMEEQEQVFRARRTQGLS